MPEVEFALGEPVRFTHTLFRSRVGEMYRWVPSEVVAKKGFVVGKRNLANGMATGRGGGFEHGEGIQAYLVTFDMRRKPVLVLPEHLTHA